MKKNRVWTKTEREYLAEITPGRHYKEIVQMMVEKFNDEYFTYTVVKSAINRYKLHTGFTGHFPKGNTPFNKGLKGYMRANRTSFKKGNVPANHLPVGSERIDADGYTLVKVAEPNKWELKHRVIWKEHYGVIPKNHVVLFLDQDKANFNLDNLILISRKELVRLNSKGLLSEDKELTQVGVNLVKLSIKILDIEKEKKNG